MNERRSLDVIGIIADGLVWTAFAAVISGCFGILVFCLAGYNFLPPFVEIAKLL